MQHSVPSNKNIPTQLLAVALTQIHHANSETKWMEASGAGYHYPAEKIRSKLQNQKVWLKYFFLG